MKKIRSIISAVAAVSLLALTVTSCEKVAPDAPSAGTPDNAAVTEADNAGAENAGNAGNNESSKSEDSTADAKPSNSADEIGKPPKMNENNLVDQQVVDEGLTLSLPDVEASAGEEVSFKVDLSDNSGLTTLIAWIDFNKDYFEYVSAVGGDADDEENEDSVMYSNLTFNTFNKEDEPDKTTLVCLYLDGAQQTFKENTTFATVTLKVKEDTPAGKYDLAFDPDLDGNGGAMCNDYDRKNEVLLIRTPKFKNGSITVK
ncbi:MAG: hypothetical protein J6U36_03815 [Oscillospiraceae bacterium]|nr:hypothetical protein [Oscillospiraceae bacterium]MBP1567754.1 hypothetical protein [Oscillospiraceae bacterium]MBP1591903.1 hypothetical protein [Oscillospiraceae bacterium]MBQ5336844.1 hypothetical protein [Oscillospiraceae bacterium]